MLRKSKNIFTNNFSNLSCESVAKIEIPYFKMLGRRLVVGKFSQKLLIALSNKDRVFLTEDYNLILFLFQVSSGCKECGCYDNNNHTKICAKCEKRSIERKEIILEIKETEESYGRDLTILKEVISVDWPGLMWLKMFLSIFTSYLHINISLLKKYCSFLENVRFTWPLQTLIY